MSFINITYTRATYCQYFTLQNPKFRNDFGIGLGLFTLGATSYAAYYSKIQAEAAIAQVHTQEINNK